MTDWPYAFTILLATLGPIKIIPPFFLLTHNASRRTIWRLALRSTIVATVLVMFVALFAAGTMAKWRVSVEAVMIAGGILLLTSSIKAVTGFTLVENPVPNVRDGDVMTAGDASPAALPIPIRWTGTPVLSPIVIPTILPPIGVVVILVFADAAVADDTLKLPLILMLLGVMALNFLAMVVAGPIMRRLGVPILQTIGWVLSALQAGFAVQAIIIALQRLHVIPLPV
jgi:multiple antibiotic resistance protein